MTVHYHGTPITPRSVLYALSGRHFCVSFAKPQDVAVCHQIGQSVLHDNGAFSVWKQTRAPVADWTPFYRWVEPWIANAVHWAVIPDEIDSGSQAQDYLVSQWPFGHRGAPVWHMDEPINRLLKLADEWPRICIGSTAEYRVVGSVSWFRRIDEAFEELTQRHRFLPWLHMLRGMQCVEWGYPFASVDSTDVAQNHNRRKPRIGGLIEAEPHDPGEGAVRMASRWDAQQCPDVFTPQVRQGELVA